MNAEEAFEFVLEDSRHIYISITPSKDFQISLKLRRN